MSEVDDILAHFGVKGQKWGVRRSRSSSSSTSTKSSKKLDISEDAATALAFKKKAKSGTSALSNKDLQTLVTRMNLEQQYSNLASSRSGKAKIKKGHSFAKDLLSVGKTVGGTVALVKTAQKATTLDFKNLKL
jgi:hypothetical protein